MPLADDKTKRAALLVATISSFIGPFMSSSVNVALPSIGVEYSFTPISLTWVNTAFLLAAATLLVPFGRLGDIYGRKRIYTMGVAVFTISSALIAGSGSGALLIVCRVLQGAGGSMIFATGMPILISVFPPQERGKVLGIAIAAVYLGLSTGPFLGGIITQHLGWRTIFWLNVPLGAMLVIVVVTMLKGEWSEDRGARFDITGSVVLGLALFALMYGFSKIASPLGMVLTGFGVVCLVSFVTLESRITQPLVDIDLFRKNTVFAFSNLAALVNYAATFAVAFLLSLYLQEVRGLTPQQAGIIMVSQPVMQAVVSPLAGVVSDHIEPRTVSSIGMAITLVGLIMMIFVTPETATAYIIACLLTLGLGFGLFSSPNTNAIMSSIERRYYGVGGAMVGLMRQIGMMFSMGIVMMMMDLMIGGSQISVESQDSFMSAMRISFTVFAAMCFGGIFASLARGKLRESQAGDVGDVTVAH